MSDPTDATAMISTIAEKVFTIAECPECETFTGARRAWCLNESQDITRSNKWRRGFNLPPLGVTHTTRPRITQEATRRERPPKPCCKGGPGYELQALLKAHSVKGCGLSCDGWAAKMNAWGVEGCREHRQEIVDRLRAKRAEAGLLANVAAMGMSVVTGVAFEIDLADPCGWLVDEAIRRAEAKQGEACQCQT
jgi:hypothetical protein